MEENSLNLNYLAIVLSTVATFFLSCVAVAGAFGAATVSLRILLVQTAPALAALACLWLLT